MKKFIKLENINTDTPSAPMGPIQFKSIDIDNVTIAWYKPNDDGGSPVQGYIVDYREYGKQSWSTVNICTTKMQCKVKKLKKRQAYQFRVVAENAYGSGKPLVSSTITTDFPFGER